MLLIPAIDLKDGNCVRLRQGKLDQVTLFSDSPVDMATRWVEAGARRLHIVDLDGAFQGELVNPEVIQKIAQKYPELPIQVGGGIRSEEAVQTYFRAGVRYAIIGTRAVHEPQFVRELCAEFPGRIIVGLDAKGDRVATDGWAKLSPYRAIDLARRFESAGVAAIVYTDIARDGMLQGSNLAATRDLAEAVKIPIIASGGITTLDDVRAIAESATSGIIGAITGRAIYQGTLDFAAGQRLADRIAAR